MINRSERSVGLWLASSHWRLYPAYHRQIVLIGGSIFHIDELLIVVTIKPVIIWDEPKRLANLANHGLDFADFEDWFDWDDFVVLPTHSSRTGRIRQVLVGRMFGALVVAAVVSPLGSEALSLVSLRVAGKKERELYERRS